MQPIQRSIPALLMLALLSGCGAPAVKPWHETRLTSEFDVSKADEVVTLEDYRELEARLYAELASRVIAEVPTGPEQALVRYSNGSLADPRAFQPDWNRTIELVPEKPRGGALLLHGMSDSPYSLRALAQALHAGGYRVLAMRMPGHGTAPSGLKYITRHDMAAAVRIGMAHLADALGERPVHMIGYSTGAALALDFTLNALDGDVAPVPASVVLISPAIRVHSAARLAGFKNALSALPGLGDLAWLSVGPEFDPYKYNSFATNAGRVVHQLTLDVDRRIASRAGRQALDGFPPVLVFKSTVDATVTTEAVVDNLLKRLPDKDNELVLFDINRVAAKSILLVEDPGPLTGRLVSSAELPFAVSLVTNAEPGSARVELRRKAPFSSGISRVESLDLAWPPGVVSLSHVAIPIPADDPLYGNQPPDDEASLFLGDIAMRGERGVLRIPGEWLLRMRYNPFYDVLETRALEWFEETDEREPRAKTAG